MALRTQYRSRRSIGISRQIGLLVALLLLAGCNSIDTRALPDPLAKAIQTAVAQLPINRRIGAHAINPSNAEQVIELDGANELDGAVSTVTFRPDGRTLMLSDLSGAVRLWAVDEAKEVQILQGPTARLSDMVLSADGNIIIAVTPNWIEDREFHKLWLWDIRNSEELSVLRDIGKSGQADVRGADTLAISPDGTLLALNACAGRVDLGLGGLICEFAGVQLFNTSSGQLEVDMSHAFVNGVWAIAFSPDGKLIAASGKNGTAKLFSAPSGKEKFTVLEADHHTIDVAFTPDSKTLAVALGDGTIHLFNTETGDESNVLEGHAEAVTSIAFSPDGALLASGSTDSTVGIWDVSTGQRLATLEGHEDAVLSVAFSPAGTYLASGGNDKAFRLWGLPR